ncbi:MAG: hypothetical protein GKR91_03810 [Pseudomonadales bacterium]|nr:hypothetical protein [Pseudomonadales bacterium]
MKILSVKAVPTVSWSSHHPLNFKPKLTTFGILCFGLMIFGIGEALLIAAGAGVSPWTVFAQGIGLVTGLSIGWATLLVSLGVLALWIPLKQIPGIGTLANAVIIAAAIEISLPYLPSPENYAMKIVETALGILMVGFGSGLYLIAHLGAGPRDGLMTGLQRVSGLPIAWVRTSIEITAVAFGWVLGGTVGVGTVMFALGIGPAVSIGLFTVHRFSQSSV